MSLGGWLKAKSDSEPAQHAQQLQLVQGPGASPERHLLPSSPTGRNSMACIDEKTIWSAVLTPST